MSYQYKTLQPGTSQIRLLRLRPVIVPKITPENTLVKSRLSKYFKISTSRSSISNAINSAGASALAISARVGHTMFTADLDDMPLYMFNALSYTWGGPEPTIVMN
jgi:hypothetical protein